MDMATALFLSVGIVAGVTLVIVIISLAYAQKSKQLEVDRLKIQKGLIRAEVEDTVDDLFDDLIVRLEILEGIVAEKNNGKGEKITRIK
jgi:hypothetical protein